MTHLTIREAPGMATVEIHDESGEMIGYATVLAETPPSIKTLAVHPRHRGKGHATRLLTAALAEYPKQDVALSPTPFTPILWRDEDRAADRLGRDNLAAWYARYDFRPAPTPDEPDRMIRPA